MTEENTTPPAEKTEEKTTTPEKTTGEQKSEEKPRRERRPRRGGRDRKPREAKEFEEAILQIDRVTRVVKGGRRLRFRLTVVIGDKKGRVGFGIGKSSEVMTAIQKAVSRAKQNLITVPIINGTIPHEANESFKASRVLLFPAPEGKGVIAGGAVRKILELAGVKDVLSKSHGSRNKLNIACATFNALRGLETVKNPGTKITKEDIKMDKEIGEEKDGKKTVAAKAPADKKKESKNPAAKKTPATTSAQTSTDKKKPATKKPAVKKTDADKK